MPTHLRICPVAFFTSLVIIGTIGRSLAEEPSATGREVKADAVHDGRELEQPADPTDPMKAQNGAAGDLEPPSAAVSSLAYSSWDFQLDVVAVQHEPAGKNKDHFRATLRFAAIVRPTNRGQIEPSWSGFGEMSTKIISRAENSYQAPHRPLELFPVMATSMWHPDGNLLVNVVPFDQVTYSLTTGQVLGTTGVLKLMLADARGEGFQGTPLFFSIPDDTKPHAKFRADFNTRGKGVCWFEGTATLTVLGKTDGEFLQYSD